MPDLGIGEILAIASLVAGGVGTGVSIYEGNKNTSNLKASEQAAQQAQQKQAAEQQYLDKQRALAAALPNAQAQTAGSLTGTGTQSFADILAGYAGQTGSTSGGSSNGPSSSSAAPAGAKPDFTSLLQQLQGSSDPQFSGGSAQPQQQPSGTFSLSPSY